MDPNDACIDTNILTIWVLVGSHLCCYSFLNLGFNFLLLFKFLKLKNNLLYNISMKCVFA